MGESKGGGEGEGAWEECRRRGREKSGVLKTPFRKICQSTNARGGEENCGVRNFVRGEKKRIRMLVIGLREFSEHGTIERSPYLKHLEQETGQLEKVSGS